MKKEHTLVFVLGLFLLAYVLDAVVKPLRLDLSTPYHFFQTKYVSQYPFTTASIIIKAIGLFIAPLWLFSFMEEQYLLKGIILLVLASLMQLYALQEIVTGDQIVPIEWSLSISISGAALLIPTALFLIQGVFSSMHQKLAGEDQHDNDKYENEEDEKGTLLPKKEG